MVPDPAVGVTRGTCRALASAAALLALAPAVNAAPAVRPLHEDARLMSLLASDARHEDLLDPLSRLYRGASVEPTELAQVYTDALNRRALASARASLSALGKINRKRLSPARQISYDVFAVSKRSEIARLQPDIRALTAVQPFDHFGSMPVEFAAAMALGGPVTYRTASDYRHALVLELALPAVLDQAVLRFREGLATGIVEPQLTVTEMIAQLDTMLAPKPEASPFASPLRVLPPTIRPAERIRLRQVYLAAISDQIYPALRRLRTFLHDEYLPKARPTIGLSALKGGPALYRLMIERETTLKLDPEAIHRLGLAEVARIQKEMDGVRGELGFAGPLAQFFDVIRTDPQYHPKTADELARGYAGIAKAVDAQIPRFFSRVPRTPLVIQPYPRSRSRFEVGGSYRQGAPDGTRPGVFFYNTFDLPSRFLTGMTTLYLHEGKPGHHFQISLAQEDPGLPDLQRFGGNNAFVEGWALYAETLGYPMGLYKDPRQHWGNLDDEMLRAMRLVVDTGIHAKGWSRDQAIAYMLANSGMGRTDATTEVDRYIAAPAQALSYKLGCMTIQRLRAKAEAALGPRFDIRAFHEQVLGSGALPLPILESKIDRWIAAQKG
ncbi:MAG: DUF885 domain-containing protein [Novosphingobium sp.]|nr:DUF885 domain-containing protein [Novosphingobium sp.]